MRLIAHRGNVLGRNEEKENSQAYLQAALDAEYDVEIDVWVTETDDIYGGHDEPTHELQWDFLVHNSDFIWLHAKNFRALDFFTKDRGFNVFWHDGDDYTVTSRGYIWHHQHSSCRLCNKSSRSVLYASYPDPITFENTWFFDQDVEGIYSDYVALYNERPETTQPEMPPLKEIYDGFLKSGMFWEYFPQLTGNWSKDLFQFWMLIKLMKGANAIL